MYRILSILMAVFCLTACNKQHTQLASPAAAPANLAWVRFHIPDSPLSVSLPNEPKMTSQIVDGQSIHLYQSRFSDSAITVSAILLPQEIELSAPEMLYDSMQQRIEFAFQKARSFKEVTSKRYLLNNKYPCFEAAYEFVLPQGIASYQRVRVLYTPRFFIQYIAVGPKMEIDTDALKNSLASMKIAD